jgi:membrane-bound lytic murein transglycosylase D
MDIYPLPEAVEFAGEVVPLDFADTRSRIGVWYNFYLSKPWQVELWLQRGMMVFPLIEEELRAREMPLDFKYVAVAESYLNPRAISAAGAEGLWQFTEGTARAFGLRIDPFVDERGDPARSTEAALSYLLRAREEIGPSWLLVYASFNLGIRGVQDRMLRQNSSDYWEMVFPPETDDYVPRIIAIKLIMEGAEGLGFKVGEDWEALVALEIDTDEKPMYLRDIAGLLGISLREVWLLNPQIWKP